MTFNISDHIYYVTIFTGHDSNAGTAANGFAIVSGENGDTKEIELKKKQGNILIPPFKSGRYCTLRVTTHYILYICCVRS